MLPCPDVYQMVMNSLSDYVGSWKRSLYDESVSSYGCLGYGSRCLTHGKPGFEDYKRPHSLWLIPVVSSQ